MAKQKVIEVSCTWRVDEDGIDWFLNQLGSLGARDIEVVDEYEVGDDEQQPRLGDQPLPEV